MSDSAEILVRITAPTFVAGAVLRGDAIARAAPILLAAMRPARLRGRDGLRELVRCGRWHAEIVPGIDAAAALARAQGGGA